MATSIGGENLKDNEPFDVIKGKNAVEVKTIVEGKNPKITMHKESLARKTRQAKKESYKTHTVVIDARNPPPAFYYAKGLGSFRLNGMEKVSKAQLKERIK